MNSKSCMIRVQKKGTYELHWLRDHKDAQVLLANAYATQREHRLRCQCHAKMVDQVAMVIGLKSRYYLARMPGTAHLHARDTCELFSEETSTSGAAEYKGAIQDDNGVTDIKVNFPLGIADTPAAAPSGNGDAKTGRVQRGSMGLGGLLSKLWSDSGLNTWTAPKIMPWSMAYSKLMATVANTRLGSRELSDHLHLQPEQQRTWLPATPLAKIDKNNQPYFLLLFKLDNVIPTPYGGAFFTCWYGGNFLVKKNEFEVLTMRFPPAQPFLQNPAAEKMHRDQHEKEDRPGFICLALAKWEDSAQGSKLVVVDAALMMTSFWFIPVESSYELRVANKLVKDRRKFTKPMRFDAATDVVFPDFILSDVGNEGIPMEVYGMTGRIAYDTRKREKQDIYRRSKKRYWEWTPAESDEITPFDQFGNEPQR